MDNKTLKLIIKHLANAPAIAARDILKECENEQQREQARRILSALGITPNEQPPQTGRTYTQKK